MSGATASGSVQAAERTAVFVPPSQRDDQVRMRRAHTAAARKFGVEATGPEVWGWQGRTLGRRAGRWWLRLLSVPEGKRGGRLWEGTAAATLHFRARCPDRACTTCWTGPGPQVARRTARS